MSPEEAAAALADYASEVATSDSDNFEGNLRRYLSLFQSDQPLGQIADRLLPQVLFDEWYAKCQANSWSLPGDTTLDWPIPRAEKAAMQLELLRRIASRKIPYYAFCSQFCSAGPHADANIHKFVQQIFLPFQRDFVRILEAEAATSSPSQSQAVPGKATVFISCGQRTPAERQLGQQICALVTELTPFKPYFAEDQTTVEGLTTNIFKALHNAAGLIAVLHKRGVVSYDAAGTSVLTRASVFVEQEIAIAAFVTQALGRPLHVAAFIDPAIKLEGVREHILLNPQRFEDADQILSHLRLVLPTWTAAASGADAAAPELQLKIAPDTAYIAHQQLRENRLSIILHNASERVIAKYHVELLMPKGAVESPANYLIWVRDRSQHESDLFRFTESHRKQSVYPGDSLEVGYVLFSTRAIGPNQSARATLFVDGYPPQSRVISLG